MMAHPMHLHGMFMQLESINRANRTLHQSDSSVQESQSHDHRKEHGAQINTVST